MRTGHSSERRLKPEMEIQQPGSGDLKSPFCFVGDFKSPLLEA
jgi:hypothetical protein